jgi:4-hydroxy-4-methyl-2-oxoglutarate aldolase
MKDERGRVLSRENGFMPKTTDRKILEELRKIDTPSITNVVATYPTNPLCLGLYNPWSENWYTDQSIRCMYPELGPVVGYAVTCVYSVPDPNYTRLTFMDVIDALDASPKPTILVLQQKYPPELAAKVGLAGEIMATAMQAVGCVGLISNGPSRDIDAIRQLKFQYLLSGASAGHGAMAVQAVNVPVTVGGMDVFPGELVHMDENGACKFPADKLEAVLTNVKALLDEEAVRLKALRQAKTAAEVRAAFSGHAYTQAKKQRKR